MFLEPRIKKGWLEVVCGSMFSGKTEELIRRLKRARIANQKVQIFKPMIDVRYDKNSIVSHDANKIASISVQNSKDILLLIKDIEVVGIDEAQFFDADLPDVCQELAAQGIRVIVAGLDMDYLGQPFGPMPYMLAVSEYITKLHAICVQCGHLATHSFRKEVSQEQILLGEKEQYEPRCRKCYHKQPHAEGATC